VCGIAGFVEHDTAGSRDPAALAVTVREMCRTIRHRGPDDEGVFVDEGAALGMCRLSIIDLATGHQPIANEDGTLQVVFNGEIYNYTGLRAELEQRGHRFRTSSDTETIVHGYEEWGEAVFTRLRGMFAVALWDRSTRHLLLVRDPAGIKPLYYAEAGGRLIFGSEIKTLLAEGRLEPALDLRALDHYLTFLYTPRDRSIFRGIRKLPPGHLLRWTPNGVTLAAYWMLPAEIEFRGTEDDAADQLHAALAQAVRSHMASDVPLGAFLSGGLDSGVVVGLMAEASSRPVRTFSIGFDEPAFDELDGARSVAAHFGTEHHEFVVRPDALSILDQLIAHFDEPFGDVSAIPTWYVSELASRHVTVALSGDGGDELFGGYDRYLPHPRIEAFDRWLGTLGRTLASVAWPAVPRGRRGRRFLRHVAKNPRGRYADAVAFFTADEKAALLTPELRSALPREDAEAALQERFGRFAALDWRSQMMRVDFETYLPEDVLTKVDRMSMAHSLESRVPLLDVDVVSLASALPADMKILGRERKRVFRQVAARILPPSALARRKQGFAVPVGAWFRGELRELCSDVLQSSRARQRGYFNPRFVDRLIDDHLSGQRAHNSRLWQLLVFELWHRQYLDRAPVAEQAVPSGAVRFRTEAPAVP
jgi:asparagine synthase (glutamine-hydrolysing)